MVLLLIVAEKKFPLNFVKKKKKLSREQTAAASDNGRLAAKLSDNHHI